MAITSSSRRTPRLRAAIHLGLVLATLVACAESVRSGSAPAPELPGVAAAMRAAVDRHEVAGAVTLVIGRERTLHLSAVGSSDLAAGTPLTTDALFWIASMTKPITASAVMMLQDEGKL
jgi:CubicO group peptidase (beta-lactamase class C family)